MKLKSNELVDALVERDRLRVEADRIREQSSDELARLRRELADTKDSLVDMSKNKGSEVSMMLAKFNAEKTDLENIINVNSN